MLYFDLKNSRYQAGSPWEEQRQSVLEKKKKKSCVIYPVGPDVVKLRKGKKSKKFEENKSFSINE